MRVGLIGCGYVADLYMGTLRLHPQLELIGATDRDGDRARHFSEFYRVPAYRSPEELLADDRVELVLNLTNPQAHYEVSRAALGAGKHVYSEKPLALRMDHATELVALARARGVRLSGAPANLLGETGQTIWKALRAQVVGPVRVVYAEMDDGMLHRMPYQKWASRSGLPWPYQNEMETGCTLEHAGYYLGWFAAFFGPAVSVTAFSSCQIPDKQTAVPLEAQAPDFSVACVRFTSGVVVRLTCSIVAPHDHSLRIVGERGVLSTEDCWDGHSKVYVRRCLTLRRRTVMSPWRRRYPLVRNDLPAYDQRLDYCRGAVELVNAVSENRPSRLSEPFCLHVTEMVLAIHNAGPDGSVQRMTTTFDPIAPMPWAMD